MLLSRKMGEMQGSQPDIAGQPSLQSGGDERNAWAHRFVSPSTPFASVGVGEDSKHVPYVVLETPNTPIFHRRRVWANMIEGADRRQVYTRDGFRNDSSASAVGQVLAGLA